jgi:hypothetical protein
MIDVPYMASLRYPVLLFCHGLEECQLVSSSSKLGLSLGCGMCPAKLHPCSKHENNSDAHALSQTGSARAKETEGASPHNKKVFVKVEPANVRPRKIKTTVLCQCES